MRVAIIGGGIAGLATAYELELARKAGSDVEYELFEASSRLGGVLSSTEFEGTVIERGPDSFLTEKPAALQLCRELGLERDLAPSNDAQRKTFIVIRKRLVPLPDGLMFLVPTKLVPTALTRLFSIPSKVRMGFELLHPPRPQEGDESVADLVRRHYGQEAVNRLADPLLSGIYGGDATQLSAKAVLPRLVEMEAQYGSLTRGMLAGMHARKSEQSNGSGSQAKTAPRPLFTTLRHGMQQLVDAVTAKLDPSRIHLSTSITALEKSKDGWFLYADGIAARFDGVVIAAPAWIAAGLLTDVDEVLSGDLRDIPYSSSVTMNLVYDGADLDPLPEGFGFLVPEVERRSMMACTFLHRKFPGRTAPGKSILRAFLGGARNPNLLSESDEQLTHRVREDLMDILQVSAIPEYIEIQRWPRAMAQYSVGHLDRQARIRDRVARLPGLKLAGNAYDGIGISDCIRLGRQAAKDLIGASVAIMHQDDRATAR
ncbi:protoporphyrinogen oxidase [Acidicapsa dinghuensis]|uniref:Coproporphyrinogen III oxidase n=1 Tax=Acidicapsa dinghuensis TaxID=2218256 RepID=A0ABW1EBH4_9BACT|nr:protoporphyrinogen oxidase [Acidicapsa dinghuensis]